MLARRFFGQDSNLLGCACASEAISAENENAFPGRMSLLCSVLTFFGFMAFYATVLEIRFGQLDPRGGKPFSAVNIQSVESRETHVSKMLSENEGYFFIRVPF